MAPIDVAFVGVLSALIAGFIAYTVGHAHGRLHEIDRRLDEIEDADEATERT